jgi:hypothetical protein
MGAIPRLHGGRELPTGVCKRTGALVHGKRGVSDDDVLNECSALIGMGYSDEIGAVDYVIDGVCLLDDWRETREGTLSPANLSTKRQWIADLSPKYKTFPLRYLVSDTFESLRRRKDPEDFAHQIRVQLPAAGPTGTGGIAAPPGGRPSVWSVCSGPPWISARMRSH